MIHCTEAYTALYAQLFICTIQSYFKVSIDGLACVCSKHCSETMCPAEFWMSSLRLAYSSCKMARDEIRRPRKSGLGLKMHYLKVSMEIHDQDKDLWAHAFVRMQKANRTGLGQIVASTRCFFFQLAQIIYRCIFLHDPEKLSRSKFWQSVLCNWHFDWTER